MRIEHGVNLKDYSSFKSGGTGAHMLTIENGDTAYDIAKTIREYSLPVFILGGGSNSIFGDGMINKLFVKIATTGWNVLEETDSEVVVEALAGTPWDEFVSDMVKNGYAGIEALSAIPGSVGATPIQNVGAYGSEVSDTIKSVTILTLTDGKLSALSAPELEFGYRTSIFKSALRDGCLVWSVTYMLKKNAQAKVPEYPGVMDEVMKRGDRPTLKSVREAIIEIRKNKLPDPSMIPNCGSFFKNPVIKEELFTDLSARYPDMRSFPAGEGKIKIPAGWLIEKAGLKGVEFNRVRIYEKNALVLYNNGDATYADIMSAKDMICAKVSEMFGIALEMEPVTVL